LRAEATRRLARAIPYAAMILGLDLLSSGWSAILLYHAGMAAVLAADAGPRRRLLSGWDPRLGIAGILLGCSAGLVLAGVWPWTGIEGSLAASLERLGLSGRTWLLFLPYHAVVNPLLEEPFWRGRTETAGRVGAAGGWRPVWGDLLFAGYHVVVLHRFLTWPWTAAAFLVIAAAAGAWRWTAAKTGGLLIPLLSHGAADAAVMALLWGKTIR